METAGVHTKSKAFTEHQLFVLHLITMLLAMTSEESHGVDDDLLVTTVARIEYSSPFICTPQLQCVVPHFLSSAFWTSLFDHRICLDILGSQGLHFRPFRP